jgi:hypothetical protein
MIKEQRQGMYANLFKPLENIFAAGYGMTAVKHFIEFSDQQPKCLV